MRRHPRFRILTVAAITIALSTGSAAADRLLVGTFDQRLEVYDTINGSSTVRPFVTLPDGITAMERSAGGAWLYIVSDFGEMFLVDTRAPTFSTAPGSAGAGAAALAVHPNRSEVYITSGGATVLVQDGAGAGLVGAVTLSASTTGFIDRLAATHAGDRVYAWDRNTGDLREWDLATGGITSVATVPYDIWEMGVSADDRLVVLAGPDAWNAAPLGDPTNPVHVVVYNRQDGQPYHTIIPQGDIPVGLAFDTNNPSKFWVASQSFVQPVLFTTGFTLSPTVIGQALIRDIDANDQGDLYVLYDDKIELYPAAGTGQTVASLTNGQWRFHLEVVPALEPPSGPMARMRSRWVGLIEAALEQRWRLPWKLRADWINCPGCHKEEIERDYNDALAYLGEVKRDRTLDVAEVMAFLAGTNGSNKATASLFLDELIIEPRDKTKP
jgi:hypothetical protein